MKKYAAPCATGRVTFACHGIRQLRFFSSLLFLLFFGLGQAAMAQNPVVSGTVRDESGAPLEGVSVLIKGSTKGASTTEDGKFTLTMPSNTAILDVSYTGYASQLVSATAGGTLVITLNKYNASLTDVVVVGYGTQKRRDVTGSISTVDLAAVKDVPAANVGRLLVGQAAGVSVQQPTGQPGREFDITIRGQGSLGTGSSPLYVLDGFPIGTGLGQNINGDDIESITVLKDAVSSAIYGARGSNGVVLVNTKSAKPDQASTSVAASFGIQNIPDNRRTKMMNGVDFAQFKKERFIDQSRYFDNHDPSIDEIPEDFRYPEQTKYNTDWYDAIMHNNAPFQDYNVTLANGMSKVRSLLSVSYNRQEGALKYTNFDRFSVRENLDAKINDFITLGWKLNGSYVRNRLAQATEGRDNVVGSALLADPRDPLYLEDGSLNPYIGNRGGTFGYPNPLLLLRDVKTTSETAQLLSNAYVEVSFLKHFKFKSAFNTFINYNMFKQFVPSNIGKQLGGGPPPQIAYESDGLTNVINYSADQLLTYSNEFGKHKLNVLAGYTAQQEVGKTLSGTGSNYANDLVPYLGSAALTAANSGQYVWTTAAAFGRVNYSFDDRYLFSATFRREGSSRFGAAVKYGNFPAVSAGWRIFNESFFPKDGFLSDVKLRGSYGVTGNNAIPNFLSVAALAKNDYVFNSQLARGFTVTTLSNPDLKWEKSNTLDIGVDLAALDNRLTFTAEYYDKITTDMLLPVQVPSISGVTSFFQNIGKVQNKGIELLAGYRTTFGEVSFKIDGNISFNRSKVLDISNAQKELLTGGFYSAYNISRVGRPLGMLYGFRVLGIFQNQDEIDKSAFQDGAIPGVFKMYDNNGDGTISYDTKDMVEIGNPQPKGRYASNIGIGFRGFDLGVLITGAYGYQLYRTIEESTLNMDAVFNVLDIAKNRWRSPEMPNVGKRMIPTTNTWKWERESNNSYIYNADHIWIKNVSLGYTFKNIRKIVNNLRVYANVDNFLLFSKYPGTNPEVNAYGGLSAGSDDESYPLPRTFTIGLNFNL